MSWIVFGLGVLLGTVVGVVAVALCQMASHIRPPQMLDRMPKCQYDSLETPMLVKQAD
jgi:hypothetical protein